MENEPKVETITEDVEVTPNQPSSSTSSGNNPLAEETGPLPTATVISSSGKVPTEKPTTLADVLPLPEAIALALPVGERVGSSGGGTTGDDSDLLMGSSYTSEGSKTDEPMAVCSVHGKKRRLSLMEKLENGEYCCVDPFKCKARRREVMRMNLLASKKAVLCSIHGKCRSMQNMVHNEQDDTWVCLPELQCQVRADELSGGKGSRRSQSSKRESSTSNSRLSIPMALDGSAGPPPFDMSQAAMPSCNAAFPHAQVPPNSGQYYQQQFVPSTFQPQGFGQYPGGAGQWGPQPPPSFQQYQQIPQQQPAQFISQPQLVGGRPQPQSQPFVVMQPAPQVMMMAAPQPVNTPLYQVQTVPQSMVPQQPVFIPQQFHQQPNQGGYVIVSGPLPPQQQQQLQQQQQQQQFVQLAHQPQHFFAFQ